MDSISVKLVMLSTTWPVRPLTSMSSVSKKNFLWLSCWALLSLATSFEITLSRLVTCALSVSSDGPWNTTISGPTVGAVGHNVTFSCSANSHPSSQYSWFLNSSKLGEGPVLTRALSPNSGGRYTCMASNDITGRSSNASLEFSLRCELLGL